MKCLFCSEELSTISTNSTKWSFFKCGDCGYWTSRTIDGGWPRQPYDDEPDWDYYYNIDWDKIIVECKTIMEHKFRIAGKTQGRFLDYGCSEGIFLLACEKLGWKATGIEIDPKKIERAQKKGLEVLRFESLEKGRQFDFIMMRHVIEHIPDFLGVLKSIVPLIAPNGVLWIESPNQSGLVSLLIRGHLIENRQLGNLYPATHIHAFEPKTYKLIANESGLECIKLITYSQSNPEWFPSYHRQRGLKSVFHNAAARIGKGDNIAAIFIP